MSETLTSSCVPPLSTSTSGAVSHCFSVVAALFLLPSVVFVLVKIHVLYVLYMCYICVVYVFHSVVNVTFCTVCVLYRFMCFSPSLSSALFP